VFERFTERARDVVVFAQDEARQLKHNYIGTEHLLLGLLREEEGLARRFLVVQGVTLEDARREVKRVIGVGGDVASGQIPFTPRAKKALESALREAQALGHNYIGTEHILLGVEDQDEGVAAQILLDLGLSAELVRSEIFRMLTAPRRRKQEPDEVEEASFFEPQSPPLAPDVVAELARLSREKQDALQSGDLERAAMLRAREGRLISAARQLIRVWNEKNGLT
jgi:ATP-dependent Clp protease ATP-binding subunit ClpA